MCNANSACLGERDNLRSELKHLKLCQVKYFVLSVTATGLLLGLGGGIKELGSFELLGLAPLLIILPCWWIFFDKATSITRIVGYYRVLEDIINGNIRYRYIGWENSLGQCRAHEPPLTIKSKLMKPFKSLVLIRKKILPQTSSGTRHLYWIINWWTFFALSCLCLLKTILFWSPFSVIGAILFAPVVTFSASFTSEVLAELINGSRSYDYNEKLWRNVLKE